MSVQYNTIHYNTIFIYRAHLKTAKAHQSAVQSRKYNSQDNKNKQLTIREN